MFTYPSGFGLHVGHASNFSITDFVARTKKMQGYEVVYPTGYDSFGLPTENFAIKQNISADEFTKNICIHFTEQMKECDFDFDRTRMFATSDPDYYKRTQRVFKKLFDHGLAYKKDGLVNRCSGCQTVLANDQVVDGKCERCETVIVQKKHPQRYLKITHYADRLIDDLDQLDRPEETKIHQKNRIGRSEWTEIDFFVEAETTEKVPTKQQWTKNQAPKTKNFIICDFDWVIWDSFEAIAKAMSQVWELQSFNRSFTTEEALQYEYTYAREKPNHTKQTSLDHAQIASLQQDIKTIGRATHELGIGLHRWFIDQIKALNAKVAVVSSGSEEYVQPALIRSGLEPTHVLCFEDHHSKEEKIELICKDRGVNIQDVYYITDSLADVYELKDFLWNDKLIGVTRGQCNRIELESQLQSSQIIDNQNQISQWFNETVDKTIERVEKSPTWDNENPEEQEQLKISVFTTRPDTIYGVTAIVLAPENEIIDHILDDEKKEELKTFRHETSKLTTIDRQSTERKKHGLFSGRYVKHPLTQESVPIRYGDYVLSDYATGSVMFVPGHDERDREFAKHYNIPIKQVCAPYFQIREGKLGIRSDKPTVERVMVSMIVKHPSEDKYLVMKRHDSGAMTIPSGGVEDGDNLLETVKKELHEESGYKNFRSITSLEQEVHFHQFAPHKDENRYGKTHIFYVELEDLEQDPIDPKELKLHEAIRVDRDTMTETQDLEVTRYIREYYLHGFVSTQYSTLIHSDQFDGLDHMTAKTQITEYLDALGIGRKKKTFRLRDWSVSRQRYRGSPIPIYYTFEDNENGRYDAYHPHPDKSKRIPHAIPDDELPVLLPLDLPNYKPAGKSPLEDHASFRYYHSKDGNTYLRECDTLDTFMCSSFYYLRFLDPHNTNELISPDSATYMPVDLYVGGKEHTVWHLIYSRFIYKFLQEYGYVKSDYKEPFQKLVHQGMIHWPDGRKMSKRRGNIIDPLDVIREYDSDTMRVYLAFMGPVELQKNRNPDGVSGVHRFLKRFGKMLDKCQDGESAQDTTDIVSLVHQTIKWVTEDLEVLKFNTAISKLMIACNKISEIDQISVHLLCKLILLLAPFAPKLSQSMRSALGLPWLVGEQERPHFNPELLANQTINLPIQFNGKTKWSLSVHKDISKEDLIVLVENDEKLSKYVTGSIRNIIRVPWRICNIIL